MFSSDWRSLQAAHEAGYYTISLLSETDYNNAASEVLTKSMHVHSACELPPTDLFTSQKPSYVDLWVHSTRELSEARLTQFARKPCELIPEKRFEVCIISGSPDPSSLALVTQLAAHADYVIAADKGLERCKLANVVPNLACGDFDSCDPKTLDWMRASGAHIMPFPPAKYATDFRLALEAAEYAAYDQAAALDVVVCCATGGSRPDHGYAALGQLAGADAASARLVEDGFEMRILRADRTSTWHLGAGSQGKTFSAIAAVPNTQVSLSGMHWNLECHVLMGWLDETCLSNDVVACDAKVSCHQGVLFAFVIDA